MKRFLLLLVLALPGIVAQADDFRFLAFQTQDGTVQTLPAMGLRITFSGGQLTATDGTTQIILPLSELSKMFFSETEVTMIESVSSDMRDDEGFVFNVHGIRVGNLRGGDAIPQSLPRGIYIVKRQGKTEKISIK